MDEVVYGFTKAWPDLVHHVIEAAMIEAGDEDIDITKDILHHRLEQAEIVGAAYMRQCLSWIVFHHAL